MFNNYGYKLINSSYYSSNYSENCISIIPINEEDVYQYNYPCLVHGRSTKGFGIKVKHWKMGRIVYNIDMEEQYQLDLIKAIQETKDGDVVVVQLPIELIATSTLYK